METLFEDQEKEKGSKKLLFIGLAIGIGGIILIIAALFILSAFGIYSLKPSQADVEQSYLEGAYREGSPEFQTLTKKIAAQNDEDSTTISPTGMGSLTMNIGGSIRNFSGKTLTGLEVNVSVVDMFDKVVKDRTITVIPTQQAKLENNQTMPVRVNIGGIDPALKSELANIHWKVTAIKTE